MRFLLPAAALASAFSAIALGGHQSTRRSTDPPVPCRGKLGQDLFFALDHHDLAEVEALLKRGADPNSRNGLEFTPLYIAAAEHETDAMQVLLKAGADKNAETTYGTPLCFAALSGNVEGADLLLNLGVDANAERTDGLTPLTMAASVGATPLVEDLIKHKADVNAQDVDGMTALAFAARNGDLGTAKVLLAAGAKVDMATSEGKTPLMLAALNGHPDFVRMLTSRRAKVDERDRKGRTALLLAAAYEDNAAVVKALLASGANTKAKDSESRTALQLARSHGYAATVAALGGRPGNSTVTHPAREAVTRSLSLLQASMLKFSQETSCVSCHQEGLGRITSGEAQSHGFALDSKLQRAQMGRIGGMLTAMRPLHEQALKSPEVMKQLPLIEINEVSDAYGWLLSGMEAHNQPANEATAAMAMVLARQQSPDGSWTFSVPRVPMQSSFFTFTSLAVHALQAYAPHAAKAEMAHRVDHARAWLLNAKPQTSEDRAFRLLGLKWTEADAASRGKAITAILADQRPDGGWAQLPDRASDAYATGQALYALRVGGGLSVNEAAYRRGTKFLLRTQDEDGSWFVSKRAIPANNYFDAAFPHGESQYASFNGTCWATLALLPLASRNSG